MARETSLVVGLCFARSQTNLNIIRRLHSWSSIRSRTWDAAAEEVVVVEEEEHQGGHPSRTSTNSSKATNRRRMADVAAEETVVTVEKTIRDISHSML